MTIWCWSSYSQLPIQVIIIRIIRIWIIINKFIKMLRITVQLMDLLTFFINLVKKTHNNYLIKMKKLKNKVLLKMFNSIRICIN
jgi:hypothetical protein